MKYEEATLLIGTLLYGRMKTMSNKSLKDMTYEQTITNAKRGLCISRETWKATPSGDPITFPNMLIWIGGEDEFRPPRNSPYARFGKKMMDLCERLDMWVNQTIRFGWKPDYFDQISTDWYVVDTGVERSTRTRRKPDE